MSATIEAPEKRISVRIEADLATGLQELADRKYEGRLSMVVREAFRRIVADQLIEAPAKDAVAA